MLLLDPIMVFLLKSFAHFPLPALSISTRMMPTVLINLLWTSPGPGLPFPLESHTSPFELRVSWWCLECPGINANYGPYSTILRSLHVPLSKSTSVGAYGFPRGPTVEILMVFSHHWVAVSFPWNTGLSSHQRGSESESYLEHRSWKIMEYT